MTKDMTILEKAWKPGKAAWIENEKRAAAEGTRNEARFLPSPDDLVYYPHAGQKLSRFGRDKGTIKQDMVPEIADVDGHVHVVGRVMDGLDRMRAAGSISPDELDAAREFQQAFRVAGYDRVKTTNLTGVSGGGHSTEEQMAGTIGARNHVLAVRDLIGGADSPMWTCVFWVVGHGISMHELARNESGDRKVWVGFVRAALYLMGNDFAKRMKHKDKNNHRRKRK